MISKEDKKYIETSRKFKIRLYSLKLEAFILFDQGYKPSEVVFLLRHLGLVTSDKTFRGTIRRYYYTWKKAKKSEDNQGR